MGLRYTIDQTNGACSSIVQGGHVWQSLGAHGRDVSLKPPVTTIYVHASLCRYHAALRGCEPVMITDA